MTHTSTYILFSSLLSPPPSSTLFPYTTLFRSTRLFDRNTGLIAALFYSVFQPCGRAQMIAFDGELLMNLPIVWAWAIGDRKSTRLNSSHTVISYAVFCLKKKKKSIIQGYY